MSFGTNYPICHLMGDPLSALSISDVSPPEQASYNALIRIKSPLSCSSSPSQAGLFAHSTVYSSCMQSIILNSQATETDLDEPMVIDAHGRQQRAKDVKLEPYDVPFVSSPPRMASGHYHGLPLGVSSQELPPATDDSNAYFQDRDLVAQMLASTSLSSSSSSPCNAATQLGSGDCPASLGAEDEIAYSPKTDTTTNSSSTYVEGPMTPPTHGSPESLYHPRPRHLGPTFPFLHSDLDTPRPAEEGSPLRFKPAVVLQAEDCGPSTQPLPQIALRSSRPRASSGLGIYQLDSVSYRDRRAPGTSPKSRKPKRPREDEEYEGRSEQYKRHKGRGQWSL